ncbi:MAG: hypothetical protein PHW10_06170 [Candidatus Peribacteraceae bacterium]|nr:hypothetical protein [Candidatus Peribacteraceae bacterium]
MQLRAYNAERKNDVDVDTVLRGFQGPAPDTSDVIVVKYGIVHAPDCNASSAYLFPTDIEHGTAITDIMRQERTTYDVFLEFEGAGVIARDPDNSGNVRIGWGSTTCMAAFGTERMSDPVWANARLAELRDAITRKVLDLRLPLSVSVLWERMSNGSRAPIPPGFPMGGILTNSTGSYAGQ